METGNPFSHGEEQNRQSLADARQPIADAHSGMQGGLQQVNLVPRAPYVDPSGQHLQPFQSSEPPRKQSKTASQQKNASNKHHLDFNTGSTLLSYVDLVFMRPKLRFVLPTTGLITDVLANALPRGVKPERFRIMLAQVFLRNLLAKVEIWTASKRRVVISDRYEFLPMPNLLWYLINAFKPIEGVRGEKPSLYPDYGMLSADVQQWHQRVGVSPIREDPLVVGVYMVAINNITKQLGRDIFVTDITSDSLLDSGTLEEDGPERPHFAFERGELTEGEYPRYQPRKCVSPRQLSRRDEIIACIADQHSFAPLNVHAQVYMPLLAPQEDHAIGRMVAYCAGNVAVEEKHVLTEMVYPEVLPRRV